MRGTSKHTKIEFGQGSPLTEITQYVTSDITLGGEGIFVDGTVYGSTGVINDAVGMTNDPDVTLDMFFDDADNGPMDLFEDLSDENTDPYSLKVTWTTGGGSPANASYSTFPCHIKASQIMGKVKDITRLRVVLTAAGATTHHRLGAA